ncbi:short-chain dehydrogenase [Hoeflea sp.]|uniref:short-chain dehydrogenase n=1 Tax=Hoeflea sp. TaxID=1940281 RepID=UPI0031B8617E
MAAESRAEGARRAVADAARHFVKLVETGYAPTTRFAHNTAIPVIDLIRETYAAFAGQVFAGFANPVLTTRESGVAEAVWRAANDTSDRLRDPAGADAVALAQAGRPDGRRSSAIPMIDAPAPQIPPFPRCNLPPSAPM